jgi:hypothetical protein
LRRVVPRTSLAAGEQLRFFRIRRGRLERDFPSNAMHLGLAPRLLLASNCGGTLEILLRFFRIRRGRLERDFPSNAMHLGLAPFFVRPFYSVYRVVNATPSIVRLAKFRVSHCQIPQMPRLIKNCSS